MTTSRLRIASLFAAAFLIGATPTRAASNSDPQVTSATADRFSAIPLDSLNGFAVHAFQKEGLDPVKVMADTAIYRGRRAIHLVNDDSAMARNDRSGGQSLAILADSDFQDGALDVDVAAWPRDGARPDTRGFVGIAFHVQNSGSRFEAFYLRFTNGRSEDQLRRNHATQYVSEPDFPWFRLRAEHPGEYESYVDIEPKAWTRIRVVVQGSSARLYVNGAAQPCLVVNDLKLGATHGQVALWNGADTEAYFSNLRIKPAR